MRPLLLLGVVECAASGRIMFMLLWWLPSQPPQAVRTRVPFEKCWPQCVQTLVMDPCNGPL